METVIAASLLLAIAAYFVGRNHGHSRPSRSASTLAPPTVPPGVKSRLAEYNLNEAIPALTTYVRILLESFGPDIARQPSVHYPPPPEDDRVAYAKALVRAAAARYGAEVSNLRIRFADHRPGREAGRIVQKGDDYYIDIHAAHRDDDEALAVIVAHEMAHYALSKRGVSLEPVQANEELTDTAMVLVGYGPLMLKVYHREFTAVSHDRVTTTVSGLGYLHPSAVAYLTLLHHTIAGTLMTSGIDVADHWFAEPWYLLARRADRAPPVVVADCIVCGSPLRQPASGTRHYSTCRLCRVTQRAAVPNSAA